jgi:hypothetical protein
MSYNTMYPSKVLVFSEKVKGWVSFRSHADMQNGISMGNDYYTFFTGTSGNLWIHYDESISRNTFYNGYAESTVSVVLNASPESVKVFNTLNYEGSQSKIDQFVSQSVTLPFQNPTTYNDQEIYNLSEKKGWYVERMFTDMEEGYINEFIGKEGKWFNNVNRLIDITLQKADTNDFTFQGIGIVAVYSLGTITLNNIRNLNVSLQVGDMIYATPTLPPVVDIDLQGISPLGVNRLVGVLRRITVTGTTVVLNVDNLPSSYQPINNDFLMFSKYDQTDGDLLGYYAEATFINNSIEKAELFSVGSEITINSK